MLTKTQEQILAFLLNKQERQVTIRGLARKLDKSYTLVYNNLLSLEKNQLIIKNSIPPAQIINLNEFAPAEVFIEIELKRKNIFLKKYPWIKIMLDDILTSLKNIFFIILVFGGYAKGDQTANSDLDLLIIVQNKKEIREIENCVNRAYTKVKKGVNFVDISDFEEMIKNTNELNIGNEAKKNHIILYGTEPYYQILKKAYQR